MRCRGGSPSLVLGEQPRLATRAFWQVATSLAGWKSFAALQAFEPATASALMSAILIHDLQNAESMFVLVPRVLTQEYDTEGS